ncbi:MAG: hypothetical protein ACK4P8_03395 [Tabrizicola sp.]
MLLAAAISVFPSAIHAEITLVKGLLETCGKDSPERTITQLEADGWVQATDSDVGDYASMVADSWTGVPAEAFAHWTGPDASREGLVQAILTRPAEMFGDASLYTSPHSGPDARVFLSVEGKSGRGADSAAGCFVVADEQALSAAEVSALLGDAKLRPKRSGVGTEQTRMLSDPSGNQRHRRIFASFLPDTVLEKTDVASRGNVSLSITCHCD